MGSQRGIKCLPRGRLRGPGRTATHLTSSRHRVCAACPRYDRTLSRIPVVRRREQPQCFLLGAPLVTFCFACLLLQFLLARCEGQNYLTLSSSRKCSPWSERHKSSTEGSVESSEGRRRHSSTVIGGIGTVDGAARGCDARRAAHMAHMPGEGRKGLLGGIWAVLTVRHHPE